MKESLNMDPCVCSFQTLKLQYIFHMEQDSSSLVQQITEQAVSLESEYTESYAVEKRRNKQTNKFKIYRCICKIKHHSRKQMKSHKRRCEQRLFLKQRVNFHQPQQQSERRDQNRSLLDSLELEDFRRRLSALQQGQVAVVEGHNSIESYRRAQLLFEKHQSAISGILISKLASSFESAGKAGIKISSMENAIATGVIAKIQSLNFDQCVQLLSDKLARAHKLLVEQSLGKTMKTKKYNQRAFNFLSQFNQFELSTQLRLFDELIKLEATQRKNVCRYFSRLRKLDPYFAKFPPLPKLYNSVPRGALLSKVSIEQAGKEIRMVYCNEKKELACDCWMIITLGLRFQDLLKVYFITEEGVVKFLKLRESKNGNIACRFIPRSLTEMILQSGASYPTTQKRLRQAVKFCLHTFKSSYGFKHRAITAILTALHRSSPLARIHARPQMTANHYVNQNDEFFIDCAFTVGINFEFSTQVKSMLNQRNIELDLTGNISVITKLNKRSIPAITIECENILLQRLTASALDGNVHFEDVSSELISQEEKAQLIQVATISKNHQIQLSSERYSRIEEAIASIDPDLSLIEAAEVLASQEGGEVDNELLIQKLSLVSERSVHYYDFEEENIQHYESREQIEQQQSLPIIISRNNKGYSISNQLVPINKSRAASILARQKMHPTSYLHRPLAPFCLKCYGQKPSKLDSSEAGLTCSRCGWKYQKPREMYPLKKQVKITSLNSNLQDGFECVSLIKKKNNLVEVTTNDFPGKFCKASKYAKDFPIKLSSTFKQASPFLERQISKNRTNIELLPLTIRQSSISSAGKGMFCTENIPQGRLILTYTGVIGTSFSIASKEKNDSLFSAGWILSKEPEELPFEVLIDGHAIVGPARYINSSHNTKQQNVQASITIAQGEILIYFYSTKNIKKGEELFYFYGHNYWKNQFPKKPHNQGDSISSDSD